MIETVLVIVAHSDDETISMAGTIRKHVDWGDKVYVVSMTNGIGSRDNSSSIDIIDRQQSAEKASEILGFEWLRSYDFADNEMDSHSLLDIVKSIEKVKKECEPTLVYTHSGADLNIDHRVVAKAVLTAFRPHPDEKCKEIRLFEVASATDYGSPSITGVFSPNLYVDITIEWDLKFAALSAYASEMRQEPHSRSLDGIKNLAKLRGNQVGFQFAESFQVIRRLVN